MFKEIMELLTRLVVAHERQAAAAEKMAHGHVTVHTFSESGQPLPSVDPALTPTGPDDGESHVQKKRGRKPKSEVKVEITGSEAFAPKGEDAEPSALSTPVGIEDVRTLAQAAIAAKIHAAIIQDVFEKHGGSRKLPEVPVEKMGAVYEALKTVLEVDDAA